MKLRYLKNPVKILLNISKDPCKSIHSVVSASFPYQFTPEFLMTKVDLLISGGTVLPFCGAEETIFDGCIAVDGENIIAVGKREIVELEYTAKERINAHQRVILPGLINGHAHSAMTCFRGMADDLRLEDWLNNYIFPAEARNVNRELVYWGSLLACAEMIRSGTTTFCDMYIFRTKSHKPLDPQECDALSEKCSSIFRPRTAKHLMMPSTTREGSLKNGTAILLSTLLSSPIPFIRVHPIS